MQIKEEYLGKIRQLRDEYESIVVSLGQLTIQSKQIELEIDSLQSLYIKKGEEEKELLKKIQKEYGDGDLDIESGEFTPKQ